MSDVIEQDKAVSASEHKRAVDDLRKEIDGLHEEVGDLEEKNERLERRIASADGDGTEDKVNALLDEIDRPAGALRGFKIKEGAALDRALVALYDAVGRNP